MPKIDALLAGFNPVLTDEKPPPDLLITTHRGELGQWDEDKILEILLPALAHAYQMLKGDYPILQNSEISLLLTFDETIQKLNYEWRGKNSPTNVLSFTQIPFDNWLNDAWLDDDDDDTPMNASGIDSAVDSAVDSLIDSDMPKRMLGDIVLSFETCKREADAGKISFEDHVSHLFVHGLLHLLGNDHEDDAGATAMEDLEKQILAKLNIKDPYNNDAIIDAE